MKKILIALLVLAMSLTFFACGKGSNSGEGIFSLEEMVTDTEFQQIFADSEDDMFTYAVSATSSNVLLYEAHAKKTYDDVEFLQNLTDEEISDKFSFEGLQKILKMYGFGKVTVEFKMFNGDDTLITERTFAY